MSVDWNRMVIAEVVFLIGFCRFGLNLRLPSVMDCRVGPSWDVKALVGLLGVVTTAIEGDKGVLGERGLADWALMNSDTLALQPSVDARPAVEVATESNNRINCKVQADVAVEAPTGRHCWLWGGFRTSTAFL